MFKFNRGEMFLFGLLFGCLVAIPLSWVAHLLANILLAAIGTSIVLILIIKWFAAKFRFM